MTENFFLITFFSSLLFNYCISEENKRTKKWHVAGQECQIGSWKPYPLLVRAKKADNHWQNILLKYFANGLENSGLGGIQIN